MREQYKLWYAVLLDNDDNDWGYGSNDKYVAMDMLASYRNRGFEDSYIAVIENDICIDEWR